MRVLVPAYSQMHTMSKIRILRAESIIKLTVPKKKISIERINDEKLVESVDKLRITKHSDMCNHTHQHPVPGSQSAKTIKRWVYQGYIGLSRKSQASLTCYFTCFPWPLVWNRLLQPIKRVKTPWGGKESNVFRQ